MLPISPVDTILVDGVSKLPHLPNLPSTIVACCYSLPLFFPLSFGTFHSPSESISSMDFRFCFVVQAQLYQSATRLEQNTACGWMMDIPAVGLKGSFSIAHYVDHWLWAGICGVNDIRAFTRYTLRFTLLAPATLPLTSRLIASSFAKGSVLTQMPSADAVSAT